VFLVLPALGLRIVTLADTAYVGTKYDPAFVSLYLDNIDDKNIGRSRLSGVFHEIDLNQLCKDIFVYNKGKIVYNFCIFAK
jgi:hypothetical protein